MKNESTAMGVLRREKRNTFFWFAAFAVAFAVVIVDRMAGGGKRDN